MDNQITTLLEKLKELVERAKSSGKNPPDFDLCEISVQGTNPFCDGNRGIERKDMPQLRGNPVPDSPAADLPKDSKGTVSIERPFITELKSRGVKLTPKKVDASHLRATQNQLIGSKVIGMISALEKNPSDPHILAPIFISRDGYVLDGHHRWAAIVGHNFTDNKPIFLNVIEVDIGIDTLVDFTNNFADSMGIKQKAARLRTLAERLRRAAL